MFRVYKIKKGDILKELAKNLNVSEKILRDLNGFNDSYQISVGEDIVIPYSENPIFDVYTVQKGDNLYSISTKLGVPVEYLISLNGLEKEEYIYPNQQIIYPKKGYEIYFVSDNDTLDSISKKLGLPIEKIIQYNHSIFLTPEQIIIYRKD